MFSIDKFGCWNWEFGAQGKSNSNPDTYGPYRKFYEIYKGSIPKGLVVMHTCDNRKCVNPDHLVLGRPIDNFHDTSGERQTKKLLAGLVKEKHFSGARDLYKQRDEVTKKLLGIA
jgi:hypothetical protein